MNVKLAAQVLNTRVYSALRFLQQLNLATNCTPTADFCLIFNDAFDTLNCRNKISKKSKFNISIKEENFKMLNKRAQDIIKYIENVCDSTKRPILYWRPTGKLVFWGLLCV